MSFPTQTRKKRTQVYKRTAVLYSNLHIQIPGTGMSSDFSSRSLFWLSALPDTAGGSFHLFQPPLKTALDLKAACLELLPCNFSQAPGQRPGISAQVCVLPQRMWLRALPNLPYHTSHPLSSLLPFRQVSTVGCKHTSWRHWTCN